MSTDCSPGDFLIVRVNSPTLSDEMAKFLRTVKPVGVHFGADAFLAETSYHSWIATFQRLREQIRTAVGREHMIWALDHEGGRVIRAPAPITRFPYPMNWQEKSRTVGKAMGRELRSLGINLLLGPCLDVPVNAADGVIGPRAFDCSPTVVEDRAKQFLSSLQSCGVQACVKHFPGHGGTSCDSHFELPSLDTTRESLTERDLYPFARAIEQGVPAVMFAHILFNNIDPLRPASLSSVFHRDILRTELNFDGASFSDDLDMKAISQQYSPAQIARSVIDNEMNFVVFNHSLVHARNIMDELSVAMSGQTHKMEHIARRTEAFLQQLSDNEIRPLDEDVLHSHAQLASDIAESYHISIKDFDGA